MPLAENIEDEGVLVPPSYLAREGRINHRLVEDLMSRVRNREEREGDIKAQLACLERDAGRLDELVRREGSSRKDRGKYPLPERAGCSRGASGKTHLDVAPGDRLEIRIPGGGGWGK